MINLEQFEQRRHEFDNPTCSNPMTEPTKVCVWKYDKAKFTNLTSCGTWFDEDWLDDPDYIYCPKCRKKIVEKEGE